MPDTRQHVLVVGAKNAGLESIAPMLRRAEFSVHTVDPSPFLLDLVLSTAFELLIVSYPMDTVAVEDLFDAVRDDGSACHDAGVAGAPKIGVAADWADRIAQGEDTLVEHAINGIRGMPPKGTCMSCSDEEIRLAVEYMVGRSQ